jgi:hypothetical protein
MDRVDIVRRDDDDEARVGVIDACDAEIVEVAADKSSTTGDGAVDQVMVAVGPEEFESR